MCVQGHQRAETGLSRNSDLGSGLTAEWQESVAELWKLELLACSGKAGDSRRGLQPWVSCQPVPPMELHLGCRLFRGTEKLQISNSEAVTVVTIE